jgi:hypothetical protein
MPVNGDLSPSGDFTLAASREGSLRTRIGPTLDLANVGWTQL